MRAQRVEADRNECSAEDWLARLQSPECTASDRAAFEHWRASDPKNAEDYAFSKRIHERAAALGGDPLLRAAARTARRTAWQHQRRRWKWAIPLSAAAMVLMLVGFVGVWYFARPKPPIQEQNYATTVGVQRTVRLSDGTVVLLDTNSAVTVRYGNDAREVTLKRGRAQFTVAHGDRRPFLVHAGGGIIRDIGTQFQTFLEPREAIVTLLQGSVSISLPDAPSDSMQTSTLSPGQQISFDRGGHFSTKQTVDLDIARGWTKGELNFQKRSLAVVVSEMNRYSTTKLRLGEPSLRNISLSGVFHAGDQASLIQALQSGWSLRAERVSAHEVVLYPSRH